MQTFSEIRPDIFRIPIPFENIYTTVFLIKTSAGFLLFDTATYDSDIDRYVFPVMQQLGAAEETLKYVCLSHSHRDHAGGLARLMQICPKTCILSHSAPLREAFARYNTGDIQENAVILQDLRLLLIPGHAPDCAAVLDTRSNTLLTGDCLQVYGIYGSGEWGTNINMQSAHRQALQKLRTCPVETIIASHDYHPYGYIAEGKPAVELYYAGCEKALDSVSKAVSEHPDLDDAALAAWYTETTGLPRTGAHVFAAARREMHENVK